MRTQPETRARSSQEAGKRALNLWGSKANQACRNSRKVTPHTVLLGGFMEITSSDFDGLRAVCGIKSIHQWRHVLAFCDFLDFDILTPRR